MAKVYKFTTFIVDPNDDYTFYPKERVAEIMADRMESLGQLIHVSDIQESGEFEWDDNLKINNVAATNEDFDAYLKLTHATISLSTYSHLLIAKAKLERLEAYGVDNWSGYGDAISDSEGIFGEGSYNEEDED